jgi:hypothetical protein
MTTRLRFLPHSEAFLGHAPPHIKTTRLGFSHAVDRLLLHTNRSGQQQRHYTTSDPDGTSSPLLGLCYQDRYNHHHHQRLSTVSRSQRRSLSSAHHLSSSRLDPNRPPDREPLKGLRSSTTAAPFAFHLNRYHHHRSHHSHHSCFPPPLTLTRNNVALLMASQTSSGLDPGSQQQTRKYKRTMNLIHPNDERDYIPIADHGLIGNLRTAALVSLDGSSA